MLPDLANGPSLGQKSVAEKSQAKPDGHGYDAKCHDDVARVTSRRKPARSNTNHTAYTKKQKPEQGRAEHHDWVLASQSEKLYARVKKIFSSKPFQE
jgi:hypothetical protein